jgi:hypothetical protein
LYKIYYIIEQTTNIYNDIGGGLLVSKDEKQDNIMENAWAL